MSKSATFTKAVIVHSYDEGFGLTYVHNGETHPRLPVSTSLYVGEGTAAWRDALANLSAAETHKAYAFTTDADPETLTLRLATSAYFDRIGQKPVGTSRNGEVKMDESVEHPELDLDALREWERYQRAVSLSLLNPAEHNTPASPVASAPEKKTKKAKKAEVQTQEDAPVEAEVESAETVEVAYDDAGNQIIGDDDLVRDEDGVLYVGDDVIESDDEGYLYNSVLNVYLVRDGEYVAA